MGSFFSRLKLASAILFPRQRAIKASYNAASRSQDALRNFAGSDFFPADHAMRQTVRRTIAVRARNEFANNSFAYGIVYTLADDTIGTGPKLQLELSNAASEIIAKLQAREARFHKWAREVGLNDMLRCARIAKAIDGETFIVLSINPGCNREIKLEPKIYEAEFVASDTLIDRPVEYHPTGEPKEVDGIIFDIYGNPVQYRFWRVHPGSPSGVSPRDSHLVDASNVIHYGNFFRAGQHRGLSEMTAALHIFNDLRRYSTAVVLAAEVAARLSFIISNDLPPELYESTIETDDSGRISQTALDIQGPSTLTSGDFNSLILPAGYHAAQMKSEQPTNTYVSFKDSKIAEAARVFSMPFNVAVGNSSSYNYASGRLDHQVYHRKLKIERETIGCRILDPIFTEWQEMDRLIHPADYAGADATYHTWMWDGFEHVDPVKEANAAATRLAIGLTSLSEECALEGKDVETVTARRQREIQDYKEKGLAPLPWMNGGASPATSKQSSDEDKE